MPLSYTEWPPGPVLDRHVDRLWSLESKTPGTSAHCVYPDGCVELVIHLEEPIQRVTDNGTSSLKAAVVGQLTGPIGLRLPGGVSTVGARFRPAGARPFLKMPLSAITGRSLSPTDVWGPAWVELQERLHDARDRGTRISILREALEHRLLDRAHRRREPFLQGVAAAGMRLSVRRAAAEAGVSVRTLERVFLSEVGLPPRHLRAILRFQAALSRLAQAERKGLALFAVECGYADQAHFAREFRRFTGTTPAAFAAAAHPLSDRLVAARDGR